MVSRGVWHIFQSLFNARSVRGLHKSIPAIFLEFDEFTVFALFPHIQFKGYR